MPGPGAAPASRLPYAKTNCPPCNGETARSSKSNCTDSVEFVFTETVPNPCAVRVPAESDAVPVCKSSTPPASLMGTCAGRTGVAVCQMSFAAKAKVKSRN